METHTKNNKTEKKKKLTKNSWNLKNNAAITDLWTTIVMVCSDLLEPKAYLLHYPWGEAMERDAMVSRGGEGEDLVENR